MGAAEKVLLFVQASKEPDRFANVSEADLSQSNTTAQSASVYSAQYSVWPGHPVCQPPLYWNIFPFFCCTHRSYQIKLTEAPHHIRSLVKIRAAVAFFVGKMTDLAHRLQDAEGMH